MRMPLGELQVRQPARIIKLRTDLAPISQIQKLMDMGFLEGADVEILHLAPFGGDPIAIQVKGALIAIRRGEANLIEVETHD